jgi:hypothetical protein
VFSWRIFGELRGALWQLNPGVSAAVVDRSFWRSKLRIGESSHRDTHGLVVPDLGVEHGRATRRTESEQELRALIADPEVFRSFADYFERCREAGERCEDTARSPLTSKAMTYADTPRLAFDLYAQLAAGT